MPGVVEHALGHQLVPLLLGAVLQQELVVPGPRVAEVAVQEQGALEPVLGAVQLALGPEDPRRRDLQQRVVLDLLDGLGDERLALRARLQVQDALRPEQPALGHLLQRAGHEAARLVDVAGPPLHAQSGTDEGTARTPVLYASLACGSLPRSS
ncbi:hypothetical protein MFIFM68171_04051 [Madurella fahalii]|uniref:Secreted protein n=1 Tax=Madurella fahalii TaxID=1157608 RepID=A0ABQ0G7Z1_9PEZI